MKFRRPFFLIKRKLVELEKLLEHFKVISLRIVVELAVCIADADRQSVSNSFFSLESVTTGLGSKQ